MATVMVECEGAGDGLGRMGHTNTADGESAEPSVSTQYICGENYVDGGCVVTYGRRGTSSYL